MSAMTAYDNNRKLELHYAQEEAILLIEQVRAQRHEIIRFTVGYVQN